MSAGIELADIGAGFAQPVFDAQSVFRTGLGCLARPGTLGEIEPSIDVPAGMHRAAGALLLALLDQDTRLWLSPSLQGGVAPFLRFHTGCVRVADPADADFALVGVPRDLPPLAAFAQGDELYPDRSTTVVLQVASLSGSKPWRLSGPGIEGSTDIAVDGIGDAFVAEWEAQCRRFPCGVDVFLTADRLLMGLPRTTRIAT